MTALEPTDKKEEPTPSTTTAIESDVPKTESTLIESEPVESEPVETSSEGNKTIETKPEESKESKDTEQAGTSSSVFSMFGGGAKKDKKFDEDRGDTSGSNKAQREAAAAAKKDDDDEDKVEDSEDVHFEPVIKLTEKVETKTNEESEECLFKMRAKLFKFVRETAEWKERGTGDVRLLKHKDNGKTRLVMRRDKTLKVCANHYITPEMNLQPHATSDRSWVWSAAADVSEGESESMTLAIRFANPENANLFKDAFEQAKGNNAVIFNKTSQDA